MFTLSFLLVQCVKLLNGLRPVSVGCRTAPRVASLKLVGILVGIRILLDVLESNRSYVVYIFSKAH